MSFKINQKDDLYYKLSDLQQKLRESEEERSKLERTCDILLRAFREEEKMRYKALNDKYERFLQDCRLRRKRNDIILTSLCRVEDKARALFARTERLKLSKDRYISYVRENKSSTPSSKILSSSTLPQKNTDSDETASKFVHWKSPQIADYIFDKSRKFLKKEEEQEVEFLARRNDEDEFKRSEVDEQLYKYLVKIYGQRSNSDDVTRQNVKKSVNHQEQECQRKNEGTVLEGTLLDKKETRDNLDKSNLKEAYKASSRSLRRTKTIWKTYFDDEDESGKIDDGSVQRETKVMESFEDRSEEKLKNDQVAVENEVEGYELKEAKVLRERGVVKHQESIEKLKIVLEDYEEKENQDLERFYEYRNGMESDHKIIEKDETEGNEKIGNNLKKSNAVESSPEVVKMFVSDKDADEFGFDQETERDVFDLDDNNSNDCLPNNAEEAYPMGLDGVDYQNETYPESYYEQPVREHSYTSIASNVILEEDENEVEAEQQGTSDESSQNLSFSRNSFGLDKGHVQEAVRNRNDECKDTSGQRNKFPDALSVIGDQSLIVEQVFKPNKDEDLGRSKSQIGQSSQEELKGHDYEFRNILGGVEPDNVMKAGQSPNMSETSKSEKDMISTENKLGKTCKGLTNFTQSNLAQLLESDSESFQIEHGDLASANEDSDFDFSFRQNSS